MNAGETKKVKCLVCGEIFDASLKVCPVCGVGSENFVPVESEEPKFFRNSEEHYVILGNGAAGIYAAKAIRERDRTGSIIMISNEAYSAYNRPMLTKSIRADLNAEELAVVPGEWYRENHVYELLGKEVIRIDSAEKEIETKDGLKMQYTKLIYALGSECFVPPIPGIQKPQAIAIRRLDDVKKVAELLPKIKHTVVIGGGVLGLEAAWEIKKSGSEVTVLELAPQLMGRQLDETAAELLQEISEAQGIAIQTGVQIAEITGETAVTGVKLGSGEVLPAELVIVSCGVRANTALAKEAGMEIERAVVVNENMETSLADIYACGDCAQYQGVNYAIWPEAAEQGKTAGANAAGDTLKYTAVPAALNFHGMDTALFSAGDNGKNPNLEYTTEEFLDREKKQYRKLYFSKERLCGVILIGDMSKRAELMETLE